MKLKCRDGSILVSLTGVMLVLAVIGLTVIGLTQSSQQTGLSAGTGGRAHYLAESGLLYAQHRFCTDGWEDGAQRALNLENGESILIVRSDNQFVATGIAHPGTAMEARAQAMAPIANCLEFGEDGDPSGDPQPSDFVILGSGDTHVRQGSVVDGSVAAVNGTARIEGTIYGDVVADVIRLEHGGGNVIGNLFSTGMTHLSQGFLEGDVHAGGDFLIEGSSTAVNGTLYVMGDVIIRGGSMVEGNVHAQGRVLIQGSGRVIGNVRAGGDIILEGSGRINGDADAGGIIQIASESTPISGRATAALDIVGPGWFGEAQWNAVVAGGRCAFCEPALPIEADYQRYGQLTFPSPTSFTTGGETVGNGSWRHSVAIAPGTYGNVNLNGSESRLYLTGGDYFFDSIRFGFAGGLFVDLSSGQDVHIFVSGNVNLGGQFDIHVSLDGTNYVPATDPSIPVDLAARIYLETHGSFSMGSPGRWFGSVHTPHGTLTVGQNSRLIGGFYSGGGHNIGGSSHSIIHVPPNFFR